MEVHYMEKNPVETSVQQHLNNITKSNQPYLLAQGSIQSTIHSYFIVFDKHALPCKATGSVGDFVELFKAHYVCVFTGERVNLTCVIESNHSDWRYEWNKNRTKVSQPYIVKENTLTIEGSESSDEGQYTCRGRRGGRPKSSQSSSAVSLSVKGLPTSTLTVTPGNTVFTGEEVRLKCVIESNRDWRYDWYKDSVKLQSSERYTVNTDTLTIRAVTTSDEGQYTCRGQRNGRPNSSQSSSAVSLSVKGLPTSTLTVTPGNTVFTGEEVRLTCVIESNSVWRQRNGLTYDQRYYWTYDWTPVWKYEWYKGSVKLPSSDRYTVNTDTLTIRAVTTSDEGQYTCRGQRNGRPNSSQSSSAVSLSVKDLPTSTLTVTPGNTVFTGEEVRLTCVIESNSVWRQRNGLTYDQRYYWTYDWTPVWKYEWYKGSVKLQSSDRYTVNTDTLTIRAVTTSDEGQYTCRGQRNGRPNSSQSSSAVSLSVKALPRSTLTVTPDNTVFTGERVRLTCVIESDHRDWRYEWNKGSVKLQSSDLYTVKRNTLTIEGSESSDEGQYTCRGHIEGRSVSSQSSSVSLSVKALPRSTLTVTPDNTVFTGERVNLKCVIESYSVWRQRHSLTDQRYYWTYYWTPVWRYEWNKDRVMLQWSDRYTVNTDTLTIRAVTTSDEGQYTCRGQRDERPNSSQSSSVSLSVTDLKPKPELRSDPAGAALTGNTVTLTCRVNLSPGWDFYWYKHTLNSETKTETNSYRVKIDSVSDGGQYWCRAGRGIPVYYTQYSDALWVNVTVSPKAVVTVRPDEQVFRRETVSLRCDIKWGGDTEWTYRWETEGTNYQYNSISTQELNISSVKYIHRGKYTCTGLMGTQRSQRSDAVTLNVSAEAQAAVRVSPQPWLTEGDSVTLICEVTVSSTGWTFSWFRDDDHLSDSSRGAGGSYTLSPAARQHTGVYTCRAERGRPAYNTKTSNTQPLWITGVSPSVSLVVRPSRSQHFSSDSLSLSCEDQTNSSGWTVRRYTDRNTEDCSTLTGSTCRLVSLSTSDSGVYWCESESGEKHHPLNITVHDGDVILESSVDPVIEGQTLTLHCLHRSTNSPILRADFYKDGSLVQNQTTGEMIITTVSESDEGFYYCKTERGQSPHSWISVRVLMSFIHSGLTQALPRSTLTVTPDKTVFTGERVRLTCVIESNRDWRQRNGLTYDWRYDWTYYWTPDWRYVWYKDSVKLQSSDRHTVNTDTLTIRAVTTSDEGQYTCRGHIEGRSVSSQSSSVSLSVKDFPRSTLTVTPDNTVFTGERVILKCVIESNRDWRYEWNKDSVKLQSSQRYTVDRNTLTIEGSESSDEGQYTCRGHIEGRSVSSQSSSAVSLSVKAFPRSTLTVTPDNTVFTGERVRLKCVIESNSVWRYVWYKDSVKLESSERYTVNTDTLTIRAVTTSDEGQYTCRGQRDERPNSSQSSSVSLSVKDLPKTELTVDPKSPVFTGETVNLKCVIESNHTDWRYEWNKDSVKLQSSQRYTVNTDTLTIRAVTTSDEGQYTCRGQRDKRPNSSQSSSAVSLSVKDSPRSTLTVTPDNTVFTGERVILTCVITPYYNNWRYEWWKGNSNIQPSQRYTVKENTLTIEGSESSDAGQYKCRGHTTGGSVSSESNSVSLSVKDLPKPQLTVDPESPVFTGETVNLKCVIESYSYWTYEWWKDTDRVKLQSSDRYTVNTHTLTISGATKSDAGQFWCKGQRHGSPSSSQESNRIDLAVNDLPRSTLTVTPDNTVFTGERVRLKCVIESDHSDWRYEWNKDSVKLQSSQRHTVDRNTLTIEGSESSDEGQYTCRGKRDERPNSSQSSSAVSLSVKDLPKPELSVTPDRSVFTGETVNLKCVIESYSYWTYEWWKGTDRVKLSWRYTVNTHTLTISGATKSDAGQFWCKGQRHGSPSSSQESNRIDLAVNDFPRSTLTVTPDNTVFTGERVILKCVIESDHSDWRYEWYKDSVKLQSSQRHTVDRNTLTIEGSESSDEGQYTCRGKRDERPKSSQSSSAVSLSVKDSPRSALTVTPDNTVFTGERVILTCEIESYSVWRQRNYLTHDWRYEWYKDRVKLQWSDRYTVNTDTLTIRAVTTSDEGLYTCRGQRDTRPNSSQSSSAVSLSVKDLKPKPELRSDPAGAALTGNTVTLTCRVNLSPGWDFYWYKHTQYSETKTETNSYRVKIDSVSDGGQYRCRAGRGIPVYYTQYSDALWVNVTVSPKAVVTVRPDERVFRGETVSLRCDIKWRGDTEWTYRWETEGTNYQYNSISTQELNISSVKYSYRGKYTCTGLMGTQRSQRSDAVTLNVSAEAQAAVRVSPQPWLTEGDSVTLICEVTGSSTGWTFSWFRDDHNLSDSSRGAGGSYTLSPAARQHTGVYTCRAERGRPAYYTKTSNTQPLWITGVSPSVSLVVRPSRSQHFSSDSLSLSCEDQRNSSGWTVRRYTDRNTEDCSTLTGSTCRLVSLSTSDSGVYWCQSESGEKRHPLNITVHYGDVILESSVDPVIEGHTLTLHCLHRSTNSPILRADFYKDGSLVQNQTTEMIITTVSESDEGFYYCKTERGQSPHSWISVRVSAASSSLLVTGVVVGSSVCLLFFLSLLLMWRYKKNKDQQRNINQTSVPNQSAQSHLENSPLQSADSDHIYNNETEVNKRDKDDSDPLTDVTYSEVTVKKKMDKAKAESNNVTYSEVGKRGKKCESKDINPAGASDLTYAQINIQDKKKTKGKGKSSESGDTLYSELKQNTDRDADTGVGDKTSALAFWKKGQKKINKTCP
ncbi:basement membrane-specific heparan sulfate proteoglycan core protein [Carassius gibelio]|uniref:basement membrane-specific heparan sulfate proteoglycan core protein n=1 Tax=Carassius gibelio TaxID=101364 RepID=UPI002278061E|nr:basement membrane-specific heparan sulfate proteoglycan core protein [Carassius gibelio]